MSAYSNQFCAVQDAECSVQDVKLCGPKGKSLKFLSPDFKF